eukprot:COSAG01_NODE_5178_length_4430_cov_11.360887_2_plen_340_part_00
MSWHGAERGRLRALSTALGTGGTVTAQHTHSHAGHAAAAAAAAAEMDYVSLLGGDDADLRVSRLCLGCQQFSSAGTDATHKIWDSMAEDTALATVTKALDCGINFVDVAEAYAVPGYPNQAEQLVGRVIQRRHDPLPGLFPAVHVHISAEHSARVTVMRGTRPLWVYGQVLADGNRRAAVVVGGKFGAHAGTAEKQYSEGEILESLDRSLKALQTDCMDLYQGRCDRYAFAWTRAHVPAVLASLHGTQASSAVVLYVRPGPHVADTCTKRSTLARQHALAAGDGARHAQRTACRQGPCLWRLQLRRRRHGERSVMEPFLAVSAIVLGGLLGGRGWWQIW